MAKGQLWQRVWMELEYVSWDVHTHVHEVPCNVGQSWGWEIRKREPFFFFFFFFAALGLSCGRQI